MDIKTSGTNKGDEVLEPLVHAHYRPQTGPMQPNWEMHSRASNTPVYLLVWYRSIAVRCLGQAAETNERGTEERHEDLYSGSWHTALPIASIFILLMPVARHPTFTLDGSRTSDRYWNCHVGPIDSAPILSRRWTCRYPAGATWPSGLQGFGFRAMHVV